MIKVFLRRENDKQAYLPDPVKKTHNQDDKDCKHQCLLEAESGGLIKFFIFLHGNEFLKKLKVNYTDINLSGFDIFLANPVAPFTKELFPFL